MSPSSLRFHLRERTAALHEAVDAAVGDFRTLDDYLRYLAGLHAFRTPSEAAIVAAEPPPAGTRWPFVPLVPLIEADMADLGLTVPAPVQPAPEAAATAAEAAGRLYVLEGSALGARVLAVRARALGLGPEHGARHLSAQAHGGPDFRAFGTWLDGAGLEPDAVLAAALAAFAEAHAAFTARTTGSADVHA